MSKREKNIAIQDYSGVNSTALMMMVLESVYILENSQNIGTIIGRSDLLHDIAFGKKNYSITEIDFQETLDRYRKRYYDRPITEWQVILSRKIGLQELQTMVYERLVLFVPQYVSETNQAISGLKKKGAIKKRLESAYETLDQVKRYLARISFIDTDSFFAILENTLTVIGDNLVKIQKEIDEGK